MKIRGMNQPESKIVKKENWQEISKICTELGGISRYRFEQALIAYFKKNQGKLIIRLVDKKLEII